MIRNIILFFLFLSSNFIISQSQVDSLLKVSRKLMFTNKKEYYNVSDRIINLAKENKTKSFLINTYLSRSMVHQLDEEYKNALKYVDLVINSDQVSTKQLITANLAKSEILRKLHYDKKVVFELLNKAKKNALGINDSTLMASVYFRFSSYYIEIGDYVNGIKTLLNTIKIRPKKLKLPKAMDLMKLSQLFYYIDNLDKAEYYISQAYHLADTENFKLKDRYITMVKGIIAMKRNRLSLADSFFNVSLKSFKKIKLKRRIYSNYVFLAQLKLKENNFDSAELFLDTASTYKSIIKDNTIEANYYLTKSKVLLSKGDFKNSLINLDSADIVHDYNFLPFELELLNTKAYFYSYVKDFQKSLYFTEQRVKLHDSLSRFKFDQQIVDIEAKYEAKEKQKTIELLAANNRFFKIKLKKEQLEKFIILGGSLLSLLFIIFLGITFFKVKEKNKLIEKTLIQKEVLLKEIHHRVKNNLQLITSLLNLQSRYIKDEKAKQVSLDGKNRVRAMSLIHQFLYQKDDLVNLSLDEYFKKLVNELFEAYRITEDKICVNFDIQKIELDVDRVIPLGLIFNELFTNILKYAFPNDRNGEVNIKLLMDNNKLILDVFDNGIGFVDSEKEVKNSTFGFTLIEALLQKWGGKFKINSDIEGTQATILIPVLDF